MPRSVKRITFAEEVDMGGMPVRQPLPTMYIRQFDPFLLLQHHIAKISPSSNPKDLGEEPHPHRGFSSVTFVFQGDVHHRDSRGNSGVVTSGGIQWLDAGSGIVHSERPSKKMCKHGGEQEIIQIWINAAQEYKFDEPVYIPLQQAELRTLTIDNGVGTLKLVTGFQHKKSGPIKPELPISAIMCKFNAEAKHQFKFSKDCNTMVYLLDGQLKIEGHGLVEGHHLVLFDNNKKKFNVEAKKNTRFLVLSGLPLNENVVKYGPFVMNNHTQVLEAIRDYKMGKMGVLIEEFD